VCSATCAWRWVPAACQPAQFSELSHCSWLMQPTTEGHCSRCHGHPALSSTSQCNLCVGCMGRAQPRAQRRRWCTTACRDHLCLLTIVHCQNGLNIQDRGTVAQPSTAHRDTVHGCYDASWQAAAEGDAQTVASAASAAGCGPWFMAHAPLLLAASPRGAAAMAAPLQHAGGDQVPTLR
jgi:hypothetical protein